MSSVSGFSLFVLLYIAPYASGMSLDNRMSPVLLHLMEQVLSGPPIQQALMLTLLTHLGLLALCFPVHRALHRGIAGFSQVRPVVASLASAMLLWVLLYAWNQWLFQESRHRWLGEGSLVPVLALTTALALALLTRSLWPMWRMPSRKPALVASVTMVALMAAGLGYNRSVEANVEPEKAHRNVILIGIDSLSQRVLQAHPEAMPHFHALYRQTVAHTNAWSPMGRTCPTWLSILSGRSPADHGGVFNLRHPDQVDRSGMLPMVLQQRGYATIFGLDERRFCSIDESFGFDVVVGPDHGALDFLIQKFNDSPLVNLFLQTGVSAWLLPHSRLNVAAHATYPAADFVEAVSQSASAQRKRLFMAVHLESAHYPYVARDARRVLEAENRFRSEHVNALTVVDGQIDQLMKELQAAGRLDDTLVVFLSDHGESFGETRKIHKFGQPVLESQVYGHGTSVVMPEQNHVVLAYLVYRDGKVVNRPNTVDGMVSLLDLKPMLERFALGGVPEALPVRDCVTFETGIRMSALANYNKMDEKRAAELGAEYYAVDDRARMHIREDRMSDLIRLKDVASRCGDVITKYDATDRSLSSFQEEEGGLVQVPLDAIGAQRVNAYREKLHRIAERLDMVGRSR
ncbi:sulfatase-like hydrolase/transferase [Aquabacterium sp. UBA2148]|uniref:sulfatase-like hydrolase/transferase n=1 Tax=Aquabacterium sp. UBA2148 TaxID=1946042 RepID=UPI002579EF2B|nr:sulfatase-like hydrolase/transferase [Aquabacterium sp. UBA2148]